MPAKVAFDMMLTDEPLMFGAAVQVVDEEGDICLWVDRTQFAEDPEGVFAEIREHLRINSLAYQRPSVHLVRPRPSLDDDRAAVV